MTTADGMHPAFSGRHPKLFFLNIRTLPIFTDLYRHLTEIAKVHYTPVTLFEDVFYHKTSMERMRKICIGSARNNRAVSNKIASVCVISHCSLGYKMTDSKMSSASIWRCHVLAILKKIYSFTGKQAGAKMWALILASACLQMQNYTDRSVSRLKWVRKPITVNVPRIPYTRGHYQCINFPFTLHNSEISLTPNR